MEPTYKIVRHYLKTSNRVVKRGLTLAEAKAHCSSPETSSRTATGPKAVRRTAARGPWFDGFDREKAKKTRTR